MANQNDDAVARKQAIFDSMAARRQKQILKKGFENWDPFEEPKDPIDIRRDATRRTTQQLVGQFLQACAPEDYSKAYGRGVLEMALGIINNDDRFVGMYEFALWHRAEVEKMKDRS